MVCNAVVLPNPSLYEKYIYVKIADGVLDLGNKVVKLNRTITRSNLLYVKYAQQILMYVKI